MTAADIEAIKNSVFHNVGEAFEAKDDGKPRFKVGYVTAPATTDDGNEVTVDLYAKFGITKFSAIRSYTHSTTDSVIVSEEPTTVVQGTELTITVGGSTDNKKRFFAIYGL